LAIERLFAIVDVDHPQSNNVIKSHSLPLEPLLLFLH